jgi:hypothetical protein
LMSFGGFGSGPPSLMGASFNQRQWLD